MDMFVKQRNFKVICFAVDKNFRDRQSNEWLGIVSSLKSFGRLQAFERDEKEKEIAKRRDLMFSKQSSTLEAVGDLGMECGKL